MLGGTSMQAPSEELPRHIAIIMDGNGRWAKRRGLPRIEGHRQGADSVREVTRAARELGVQALTLYAFSSQNWDRPIEEVRMLMALLRDYLVDERAEILDNNIRLTSIRNTDRLPRFRAGAAQRADGGVARQHRHGAVPGALLRRPRRHLRRRAHAGRPR